MEESILKTIKQLIGCPDEIQRRPLIHALGNIEEEFNGREHS